MSHPGLLAGLIAVLRLEHLKHLVTEEDREHTLNFSLLERFADCEHVRKRFSRNPARSGTGSFEESIDSLRAEKGLCRKSQPRPERTVKPSTSTGTMSFSRRSDSCALPSPKTGTALANLRFSSPGMEQETERPWFPMPCAASAARRISRFPLCSKGEGRDVFRDRHSAACGPLSANRNEWSPHPSEGRGHPPSHNMDKNWISCRAG